MSELAWMDDAALKDAVRRMLTRAGDAVISAEKRTKKNVIDPFSSLVWVTTTDVRERMVLEEIQKNASASQGISSAVGKFHQEILGSVEGFVNQDRGFDLLCEERKIIAEVKNKHNTMNDANKRKVVSDLDTAIRQRPHGWEAYLVLIIPKKPERYKKQIDKNIYEIDGASFYDLATGHEKALNELYYAVQRLIAREKPCSEEVLEYCQSALAEGLPE